MKWIYLLLLSLCVLNLQAEDEKDAVTSTEAEAVEATEAEQTEVLAQEKPLFPVLFRPGKVTAAALSDEPVQWRDLRHILLKEQYDASDPLREESIVSREPTDGFMHAILSVELNPGSSIGKYDYKLVRAGREFQVIAMAKGDKPFDPRVWEIADSRIRPIKLVFELPADTNEVSLVMALPVTVKPLPVQIVFESEASGAAESSWGADGGTAETGSTSLEQELESATGAESQSETSVQEQHQETESETASESSDTQTAKQQEENKEESQKAEDNKMSDWF